MPGDRYSRSSRRRHAVNGNVAGRAATGPGAIPPGARGPGQSAGRPARIPAPVAEPTGDTPETGRGAEADVLTSLVLADDLPDGLIVADQAGKVAVFNRAASRLTGVPAVAALGRDVRDVLPLRDRDERCW